MSVPIHVAIIPDGNRRWARNKYLPASEGHRIAAEKILPNIIKKAADSGVKYLTFWALSTDNLKTRSASEVKNLIRLLEFFIDHRLAGFKKNGVRLRFIGNFSVFSESLCQKIKNSEEITKENDKIVLIIALNYSGRDEIIRAVNKARDRAKGVNIDAESLSKELDTAGIPDPDIIIRTGGEKRLSGFMLWQNEYSELFFSDSLFPDFTENEFEKIIEDFARRARRFGK